MRVVVPFTKLHPTTEQVLAAYNLPVEYAYLNDEDAYRKLMLRLWRANEKVIIIEHDIVPWPGAVEELWQCPCAWGSYSYRLFKGTGIYHGLGCTKITPQLIAAVPKIWDDPEPWYLLDQKLLFAARNEGFEPHPHRPPVIHLGESAERDYGGL